MTVKEAPDKKLLRILWTYGAFDSPDARAVDKVTQNDLPKLKSTDKVVRAALRAYQDVMSVAMDRISLDLHGRPAIHDGEFGPATQKMLDVERCGHRDFPDPDAPRQALGVSGNWKSCHGIGDYHCAVIRVGQQPPSHWRSLWPQIVSLVTEAYRQIGLQLFWTGAGAPVQTAPEGARYNLDTSWVSSSSGWIGLAQVALGLSCSQSLWQQYLGTYLQGSSDSPQKLRLLTRLFMHETGHNCGLEHSRGDIMNPSITDGEPTWIGDNSESWLRRQYGGVPVPKKDPGPDPAPNQLVVDQPIEFKLAGQSLGRYILVPEPTAI